MGKRINRYRIKVLYKDGGRLALSGRVDVWKDKEFENDIDRAEFILDRAHVGWDGFRTLDGKRLEENKVIRAIKDGEAELVECKKVY